MFSPDIKILILDDMLTMRKIVKRALTTCGFSNIVEAKDGAEGWEKLQQDDYDLIVSDWNMPNMTGIDLLGKVRAHEKMAQTPFILLTAEADPGQVEEAKGKGVDNYIVKPFSADDLKAKLEETYNSLQTKMAA